MRVAHAVLFHLNAQSTMLPYHDREGDPSIHGFLDDAAFIRIFFRDGSVFEYGVTEIGASQLMNLRHLARMGDGLPQYLHRYELRKLGRMVPKA